jgi:hypothetical protein
MLSAWPGGRGGLTMSEEGGLEELDEFFDRRATCADNSATCFSNSAMRACCRRMICG